MPVKRLLLFIPALLLCCLLRAQAQDMERILQDICETMVEQNPSMDIENIEEQLRDLAAHPINLNTATSDDLEQLFFLSPDQVDALLLYVYHHPMMTIYELQLVPGFTDYEIRNILPFVYVASSDNKEQRTLRDWLRYASHEADVRVDARNVENFSGDPVYASLKYKMNAGNHILFGATVKRDAGEAFSAKSRYGAYLQLNDFGRLKTMVAGDYRANFGLGLVINSALPLGKSAYAANLGITKQGLRKFGGTSDDFLRGAGATFRLGDFDLTAFYSFRLPDSIARHTAGVNLTYRKNRLRVGLTAVEYLTSDSIPYRANYYNTNFFHGTRQFSASLNAQYVWRNLTFLGEVATAQNTQWGLAALAGIRYNPVQDISLLFLYRYYSKTYDAVCASTFSESTRPNDEQGGYVGADIARLKNWRFSLYTDFFAFSGPKYTIREKSWGYDLFGKAEYLPNSRTDMYWRLRAKRKGEKDTYQFRYQLENTLSPVSFRTILDASLCRQDTALTWGAQIAEQVEYQPAKVPLTLQVRVEGFYIPSWNNHIYSYENDVLYAFSIPSSYGIGARYYLNLRYKISDHYAIYLKASDTWYTKKWAERQSLASCHKTDMHLMLRITY